MLPPWLIEKFKEEERARDQASWSRQARLTIDGRPPIPPPPKPEVDGRTDGGVAEIDYRI